MSGPTRNDISKKSQYWIPKYRYLELKNFCLQYPDWKKQTSHAYRSLVPSYDPVAGRASNDIYRPTEKEIIELNIMYEKISCVEECARAADASIWNYIVEGVANGYSYDYLHLKIGMPAGRSMYYDRYRKFFYILDKERP